MAMGNPLCFVMKVAVLPKIELGDYNEIAKEVHTKKENSPAGEEVEEVTDKEVEDTILEIRKMHAQHEAAEDKTKGDTENKDDAKEKEKCVYCCQIEKLLVDKCIQLA